jgi:hypothetical protein
MTQVETTAMSANSKTETPRDKFLRLAPPRMEVALKKISLLGNLAGSGYQYAPGEAKEIIDALTREVQEVAAKFARKDKSQGRGGKSFSFSGRVK